MSYVVSPLISSYIFPLYSWSVAAKSASAAPQTSCAPDPWDGIMAQLKNMEKEVSALAKESHALQESQESLRRLVMGRSDEHAASAELGG